MFIIIIEKMSFDLSKLWNNFIMYYFIEKTNISSCSL